jgi:hypothetical protein
MTGMYGLILACAFLVCLFFQLEDYVQSVLSFTAEMQVTADDECGGILGNGRVFWLDDCNDL